ncbi:MAG: hypothetical protein ACRDLL_03355 [Solirubrobacterales bacterium]
MAFGIGPVFPDAPRGTHRQRTRRKQEAAGPYRSQSSVPSIRAKATPREHRKVPVAPSTRPASLHSALSLLKAPPPSAPEATLTALLHGTKPDPNGFYTPKEKRTIEDAQLKYLAEHENAGEPEDLTNAILAVSAVGDVASLLKAGGQVGVRAVASTAAKEAAGSAEANALVRALTGVGRKGIARRAAGAAAEKVEPAAVRAARQGVGRRVAQTAERVPRPIRGGVKVGGQVASYPFKHPFTAPFTAQAPLAAIHGDPKEFLKAAEGKGVLADVANAAGGVAGALPVGGQVAREAVNLPAVVIPSLYLTGKAGVEAAGGDTKNLDALWQDYLKTGLLPALAKGDPKAAVRALEGHPLYSALEASGALSTVGRGPGALTRAATNGRVGGLARPDLTVEGYPNIRVQRGYSRDLLRQFAQRAYDRRTGNVIRPGTGSRFTSTLERRGDYLFRRHVIRDAGDRFNANAQDAQRLGRQQSYKTAVDLLPRKKVLGVFNKLDRASADVVVHAIERIARHPETFHEDLHHYLDQLNAVAREESGGQPVLDRAEMAANRTMAAQIEKALSLGPERVQGTVNAANTFIEAVRPVTEELANRGLLHPDQAAKASLIPFARVHLGADHGPPEGLIRQAEAQLEETRRQARNTARERVAGAVESRGVAAKKLESAEAGRVAAERTVATLRAKVPAAKSDTGRASALKRVEAAQRTLETARERVKSAKAELRATHAELQRRTKAAVREHDTTVKGAQQALSEARKMDHQLIDAKGFPLTLEQLRAELARQGIEEPGFVSHRPGARRDFWAPTNERGSLPKGRRTGQSALHGSHEAGFEAVVRQLVRARGLLDRVKTWDSFITRFGTVARGIKVDSMSVAKKVTRDPERYGLSPKIKWVPVRRQPWIAMQSEIDAALAHQDPQLASEGFLSGALAKASSEAGTDGPIVFMPEGIVRNMEAQFQPLSPWLKGVQLSTTALKRAVLPFSPSYYFGNAIDNAIRTALAGVGPQHFLAGHQLAKRLSEERQAQLFGAAYSSVEKLSARRTHEDFAGSALQGVADAAAAFRAAPGPKQLIDLVGKVSHAMLGINSRLTERLPQYGALGKLAMQDVRNVQGQWTALLRLEPKAIEDVVNRLDNPDTLIRWQKGIEEIYGNWSRMSPHARKFLTNFFPFWTWSRAALKLVYSTLPAHHPIQTALLTAAARMTQEEREKLGLDLLGSEPLPSYLQGGIPIRGSIAPWGKYTSFGYAGHPLESVASGVVPQLRESLAAGEGRDWKGDQLGGDELSHLGAAFGGALGSYVPGFNTVQGLLHSGPGFLSPVHVAPPDSLPYLRSLSHSQQITVPEGGSGGSSSGGVDYGQLFGGSEGSGIDYGQLFGGS